MSTYDLKDDGAAPTIAAIYVDRESAHEALEGLHRAGFRRVWLGVTRSDTTPGDEPLVESDGAGFMEALGRFFGGDASRAGTLHEALVRHGLDEAEAGRIDAEIDPGNAVVLVDGEYDPAQALRILEASGGRRDLRSTSVAPDKRVERDEVRIGKNVSTGEAPTDVPVFDEELYVERRRAGGAPAEAHANMTTRVRDDAPLTDR